MSDRRCECSAKFTGRCSPAGPAEPRGSERLSDDGQELVPPPAFAGRPGVSGLARSQVQSLRQRPGGAHRHQVTLLLSLIGCRVTCVHIDTCPHVGKDTLSSSVSHQHVQHVFLLLKLMRRII